MYAKLTDSTHCPAPKGARPDFNGAFASLYNGNIGAMSVNNAGLAKAVSDINPAPLFYKYGYDQLNRLVSMRAYKGFDNGTNEWTPVLLDDYKEDVSYDPNGNILSYERNGAPEAGGQELMDELTYTYYTDKNQLKRVTDAVSAGNYASDIDNQSETENYVYDKIGNLVEDKAEGITDIAWNVYGKILSITKSAGTITYSYDAAGNRISKEYDGKTTVYVRDAAGNVMSVYEKETEGALEQAELHLYGSSRIGILTKQTTAPETNIALIGDYGPGVFYTFTRGEKIFELSNHLGNVLATVSDRKLGHDGGADEIAYYEADVVSAQDYYPFGQLEPGRQYGALGRYGFNGYENDDELKGQGNSVDFGSRIYDPRIARWSSLDPMQKKYPGESNYAFVSGNPLLYSDVNGKDKIVAISFVLANGYTLQIRMEDPKYFQYRMTSSGHGWPDFSKNSVRDSYVIDLRNIGTDDNIMSDKSIIQHSTEEYNFDYISWWDYSIFSDIASGDNSSSVSHGYRIYGNGHDTEWQSGLPTAAAGTESIDMGAWLSLAGNMSPNSSLNDVFSTVMKNIKTGDDMKQVLDAVKIMTKNIESTAEATVKVLNIIDKATDGALSQGSPSSQGQSKPKPGPGKVVYYRDTKIKAKILNDSGDIQYEPDRPATDTLSKRE